VAWVLQNVVVYGHSTRALEINGRTMAEILLFTLTGIALYFLSDWLLVLIELKRGKPLENRSVVFFVIILVLALVSFELMQFLLRQSH
jgi:hypothetical protein